MTPRPHVAVSAVVFDPAGRVLLIRRRQPPNAGKWSVPGGKVEHGEALAAAVIREVGEETGLIVEPGPLVHVVEHLGATTADPHYVILAYVAFVAGGGADANAFAAVANSDVDDVRWVEPRALGELDVTDGLPTVIAAACARGPTNELDRSSTLRRPRNGEGW